MAKLTHLLPLLLLVACAQPVKVEDPPEDPLGEQSPKTQQALVELYNASPLTPEQWTTHLLFQSVPIFATGTDRKTVLRTAEEEGLLLVVEADDFLLIRERIPRIHWSGTKRKNYLYGFAGDRLTLGPLTFSQALEEFLTGGIDPGELAVLHDFADADPTNPEPIGEFARLLATHPDPEVRDPQLAIVYAEAAIDLEPIDEWKYVDTLAAAYAAAGDFETAVQQQKRAILANSMTNAGAEERLALYREQRIFTSESPDFFKDIVSGDFRPAPRGLLVTAAAAGDADAQWQLAVFYVENNTQEDLGLVSPGLYWLREAARNGHRYAANEVGVCYVVGCNIEPDFAEAAKWFEMSANSGDENGAFNYGRMLADGVIVPRDDPEATRWLTYAADRKIAPAAFRVAFRYGQGIGTAPSESAKAKYLSLAQALNYGPADYMFDIFFFQQHGGATPMAAELDRNEITPDELAQELFTISEEIGAMHLNGGESRWPYGSTGFLSDAEYRSALVLNLTRIAAEFGSADARRKLAAIDVKSRDNPASDKYIPD